MAVVKPFQSPRWLASRQSRKQPKDAVQPRQRGQLAAIQHNNVAGVP